MVGIVQSYVGTKTLSVALLAFGIGEAVDAAPHSIIVPKTIQLEDTRASTNSAFQFATGTADYAVAQQFERIAKSILASQSTLDLESQRVLYENLSDLYL